MLALVIAIFSVSATANAWTHYATVVNCNERISLREHVSVYSERILKIPLDATVKVQNVSGSDDASGYRNGFICTYYNGSVG